MGITGSGHPFQDYNRAGIAISSDGRLLIMVNTPKSDAAKRTVFIYDKISIDKLEDKTLANPMFVWEMSDSPSEGAYLYKVLRLMEDIYIYLREALMLLESIISLHMI